MASIYKKGPDKKRPGSAWYIAYTDEHGRRKNLKGYTDKQATVALSPKLETEADLRRRGVVVPHADAFARHEAHPVGEHLADWHAYLLGKGSTAKHADLSLNRATGVVELSKVARLADLSESRAQAALKLVRDGGASLRSVHHYTRAIKGFSRWLWRDRRVREDALAHLTSQNADADRRHERRALKPEEQARLIRAAEKGRVVMKMAGPDRAMLCRIALGTGLRAAEIRSLVARSFDLDSLTPTITVGAAYSKHRRDDVQPIRADLAAALRPWLAGRPGDAPAFASMSLHTNLMIQADLEAAGIPHRDAAGKVADFHALRHCYVSALARSTAPVKVVQTLARHSTPTLTLNVYSHVEPLDQRVALDALPAQGDAAGPGPAEAPGPAAGGAAEGEAPVAPGKRAPVAGRRDPSPRVAADDAGPDERSPGPRSRNSLNRRDLSRRVTRGCGLSERRGRDSNPRDTCGPCGFQDRSGDRDRRFRGNDLRRFD